MNTWCRMSNADARLLMLVGAPMIMSRPAGAQWAVATAAPDSAGERTVLATLHAQGEREEGAPRERLLVRCHRNKLDVFVFLGWPVVANDSGLARVYVAWNGTQGEMQDWVTAANADALFAIDAARLVEERLLSAQALVIQVRPRPENAVVPQSQDRRLTFDAAGFGEHLVTFKRACPDEPWIGTPARKALDRADNAPYFDFQVDRPAAQRPGMTRLRYPAEIAGTRVSQLVQQPFNFTLMR